ncbi:MAG TPA: hypothetical protein EYP53_01190 [Candidatus Latescibacteria bacterium]|nr:hypothetical protein [Candidatus Latescibacterota bacterium]
MRKGCMLAVFLVVGCAAFEPAREVSPPQIPAGKRMLVLDSGGIESLNFAVFDRKTNEKVLETYGLTAYLSPGTYRIVIQTDLDQPVVIDSVEIAEAEEMHVRVPLGQFLITVYEDILDQQGNVSKRITPHPRFSIYDYEFRKVLGKGTILSPVKRYIVPVGDYKVSIYLPGTNEGRIVRIAEVRFGSVYPLTFRFSTTSRE